jgi:hypothetical protein
MSGIFIQKAANVALQNAPRSAQGLSKFAQAQQLATRLNPKAEEFVLNKPFTPVFKRLIGQDPVPTDQVITAAERIHRAIALVTEHPQIRPLAQQYQPQIEATKQYLIQNWHTISRPVQQVGEAFGFVTRRQVNTTIEPVRALYQNQISSLKDGIRYDVYTGIWGAMLGSVHLGATALGFDLPVIVSIPTISAGMAMLARSLAGAIGKRSELIRARDGLSKLAQYSRV